MAGNTVVSRRMGEMNEGRLILKLAVPMMLSMLVQAMYNIVDSIYVSMVSEDCLSALSLAFPAQNIMIGLATGTGVGVSTLISRALGRGDRDEAGKTAGTAIFLCFCCWVLMALFGIFGADAFIRSQTKVESIRSYADSYLRIVTTASLFLYLQVCAERFLQSTGLTKYSMWTQIIGAVTNIILDPFFIFGWCGLPAMGPAGAAIATVIGQALGAFFGFLFHVRRNTEVPLSLQAIRPVGRIIRRIYQIGFPSILMMGIGSVTNYLMNIILGAFTSTAVAVYGVYFKIQSFFFMPVFGLNNAMIPIIGYNYGAGKKDRIYRTIGFSVLYATAALLLGLRDRRKSPAAHQLELCLRGLLHRGGLGLSGAGPQHVFSLCLDPPPASGPDPGGLASVADRGCQQCLVVLSHRRDRLADRQRFLPALGPAGHGKTPERTVKTAFSIDRRTVFIRPPVGFDVAEHSLDNIKEKAV